MYHSFSIDWSPQDAMKAYLNTLNLYKFHKQGGNHTSKRDGVIKPMCMEFLSALAAGNQAKLIIHINSQGITALTIALAVAAAGQTGGRLICLSPHHHDMDRVHSQLKGITSDLKKVMRFVVGNPCEVVRHYKNIDFAIIDCKNIDDHLILFENISFNLRESSIVVTYDSHDECASKDKSSFGGVVKKTRGVESVVILPFGEGMELTRIAKRHGRRFKRFHVVMEN